MKKIGIVGLGIMGKGIAANFLKHGYTVHVWNRTKGAATQLSQQGAILCATPAEVAKKSDIVFEITANDESSKSVWLEKYGILSGADRDKILIACATLSVAWTDELARNTSERGFTFLDIPMTGGRIGAETGTLTMLAGGDEKIIEQIKPILGAIAKTIHYFGLAGQAMRYKLILNYLQALHIVGFGHAMRIAKAHHMDLVKVSEALAERPGGVITGIAQKSYFTPPDPITFSIDWITKDLSYAKAFARNIPTPLLDEILMEYKHAAENGWGDNDWTSINT